jgi:rubrerythrin
MPTATWTTSRRWAIPPTDLPIGSSAPNLKAAVAGETHEYTDMYPGMAKAARGEGFDGIADWFETLAKPKRSTRTGFQKALDQLHRTESP